MTDPQNPQPDPQQPSAHPPAPAPGYPTAPGYPQPPAPDPAYGQQQPAYGQPPAYDPAAYGQQPPAYAAPSPYAAAPPAPYGAPVQPTVPGRTMGVVAFILSFFVQVVALILGIVALVQSRKAGAKNGFAVAAIIISSVLIVVGVILTIVFVSVAANIANDVLVNCGPDGPGVVQIWGRLVPCDEIDTDMRVHR